METPGKIREAVRTLFPGYFALVMATGIIASSANTSGLAIISRILFYVNIIAYSVLCILFLIRLTAYFQEFKKDLVSHEKSAAFLTFTAGTCVLGIQAVIFAGQYNAGKILWYVAIASWLILLFMFFAFVITKPEKPTFEKGINGIWLLLVVSTQAISILGSELSLNSLNTNQVLFFSMLLFLLGCSLYCIIITLIFYRLIFFPVSASETDHAYWIDTGAAAISALSGLTLIEKINVSGFFTAYVPFIKGLVLLLWITGTWWVPVIIIIEVWRYAIKKVPIKYTPVQWSMIFAIGNYSLITSLLGPVTGISILRTAGEVFLFLSLLLWAAAISATIYRFVPLFKNGPGPRM